ncbi:hypothetical protein CSUI_011162 [Cystoisospora suis]|uniref:Transmembrane protein n=1 Tax=Cystoisospora suis TaxID=483139 RepID=A0A2C6KFB9_9APIC|nr:hypothetical protein CSUI_011162 [Cystoisospora suis]
MFLSLSLSLWVDSRIERFSWCTYTLFLLVCTCYCRDGLMDRLQIVRLFFSKQCCLLFSVSSSSFLILKEEEVTSNGNFFRWHPYCSSCYLSISCLLLFPLSIIFQLNLFSC